MKIRDIAKALYSIIREGEFNITPLRHFTSVEDMLNNADPKYTSQAIIHNVRYRNPEIALPELAGLESTLGYDKDELILQDRDGKAWTYAFDCSAGFRKIPQRFNDREVLDYVHGLYCPKRSVHLPNGHFRIISHPGRTIKPEKERLKAILQPAY